MVERKASENNLVFIPLVNKFREGKQIYQFGKLNIFIDRNVIFMQNDNNLWLPSSIDQLIEKAS